MFLDYPENTLGDGPKSSRVRVECYFHQKYLLGSLVFEFYLRKLGLNTGFTHVEVQVRYG